MRLRAAAPSQPQMQDLGSDAAVLAHVIQPLQCHEHVPVALKWAAIEQCALEPLCRMIQTGAWKRQKRLFSVTSFAYIRMIVSSVTKLVDIRALRSCALERAKRFIQDVVRGIRGDDPISNMLDVWNDMRVFVRWLVRLFETLDVEIVFTIREADSIPSVCYHHFITCAMQKSSMVNEHIQRVIHAERCSETAGEPALHTYRAPIRALQCMVIHVSNLRGDCQWGDEMGTGAPPHASRLQRYVQSMETPYLESAQAYLADRASALSRNPRGALEMDRAFALERERCEACYHATTVQKLVRLYEHVVLPTCLGAFVAAAEKQLHHPGDDAHAVRSTLWRLATQSNTTELVRDAFGALLTSRLAAIWEERERPVSKTSAATSPRVLNAQCMQNVVRVFGSCAAIARKSFHDNPMFTADMSARMTAFLSKRMCGEKMENHAATMLDVLHQGGGSAMPDDAWTDFLQNAAAIVMFLPERDAFVERYRRLLSQRLLTGKSRDMDRERQFIAELKLRCGAQFVQKLEGMLQDLFASHDDGILPLVAEHAGAAPEMHIRILTSGHWPAFQALEPRIPMAMSRQWLYFRSEFERRNATRKLQISASYSTADVFADLPFKRRFRGSISMNVPQLCVLLLFDDKHATDRISFSRIADDTSLPVAVVRKVLHAFVFSPKKLLRRIPVDPADASPVIADTDEFALNDAFESRDLRFTQPCPPLEDAASEEQMDESVAQQRKFAVDAAIVRIMKARRSMPHARLVEETLAQSHLFHFSPPGKLVKECIEQLIGRDFLERDDADQSVYRYVA